MAQNRFLILIALIFTVFVAYTAQAQEEASQSVGGIETVEGERFNPKKMWFYFGGDFGYSGITTPSTVGQGTSGLDLDGYNLGAKFTASYYFTDWALNLGGGFLYTRLIEGASQITTQAGYMEVSPRFRISDRWQLGPVADFIVGDDVSFQFAESNQDFLTMVGLKASYEFPIATSWILRVGGRLMTDINIASRQMYTGILDISIGLPIDRQGPVTDVKVTHIEDTVSLTLSAPAPREGLDLPNDGEELSFETDSANLSAGAAPFLQELGEYLSENEDRWQSLTIEGHTDQRGSLEFNGMLSEKRAESVSEEIFKTGVDEEKVRIVGVGASDPLDPSNTPSAWRKNRRVELSFEGVKDSESFKSDIEAIRARTTVQ